MNRGSCWIARLSTTVPRSLPVRLQQRGRGFHLDGFRYAAQLHLDIETGRCIDLYDYIRGFRLPKALFLRNHLISASGKRKKRISAFGGRLNRDCLTRCGVRQCYLGAGTMAPLASATRPVMVPRSCPNNKAVHSKNMKSRFLKLTIPPGLPSLMLRQVYPASTRDRSG